MSVAHIWKNLAGDIAVWLGVAVGVTASIDALLRKPQRDWLTDCATKAFVWLDDQRAGRFLPLLLHETVQRIVTVASAAIIAVLGPLDRVPGVTVSVQRYATDVATWDAWAALIALVLWAIATGATFWLVHRTSAAFLRRSTSVWRYLLRVIVAALTIFAAVTAAGGGANMLVWQLDWGAAAFLLVFAVTVALAMEWGVLNLLFVGVLVWVALIWAATVVLWTLRLFALRIAEHPKGPVFAVGAMISGFGLLLKRLATVP
jgi:hypothetical protein